jgi:para-nitrobenzyl esterase
VEGAGQSPGPNRGDQAGSEIQGFDGNGRRWPMESQSPGNMTMHAGLLSILLSMLSVTGIAASCRSKAPEANALVDPVKIEAGLISGTVIGDVGKEVRIYRGIPYAAPPVGELRWKPPQPEAAWAGVRQAIEYGKACMQNPPPAGLIYSFKLPPQSEDCLYLNIWTPAKLSSDRLPVMFWIHGGGFTAGSGSEPQYEGEALSRKGVIVVTINYRLGVFGFLWHPELTSESPHHTSGNYAFLDQIAALQWVQRNIAAFGGDPNRVTIFGNSAGSTAVNTLTASPLSKGLFQRAIGQSGATFALWIYFSPMVRLAEAEKAGAKLVSEMGITHDAIMTLRAKPADEVLRELASVGESSGPIVDGLFLPQDVWTIYAQGKQNDVPMIVGNNADEATTLIGLGLPQTSSSAAQYIADLKQRFGNLAGQFLKAYPAASEADAPASFHALFRDATFGWQMRTWARMQAKTGGSSVFRYYFSRKPPGSERDRLGAFHGLEIEYIFGNFGSGSYNISFPWDKKDREYVEIMTSYWTNFAKTGDPNGAGMPNWSAYNSIDDNVLELGDQVTMRTHVNAAGLDCFDAYHRSLTKKSQRIAALPTCQDGVSGTAAG